jgi:hypothetical protein
VAQEELDVRDPLRLGPGQLDAGSPVVGSTPVRFANLLIDLLLAPDEDLTGLLRQQL